MPFPVSRENKTLITLERPSGLQSVAWQRIRYTYRTAHAARKSSCDRHRKVYIRIVSLLDLRVEAPKKVPEISRVYGRARARPRQDAIKVEFESALLNRLHHRTTTGFTTGAFSSLPLPTLPGTAHFFCFFFFVFISSSSSTSTSTSSFSSSSPSTRDLCLLIPLLRLLVSPLLEGEKRGREGYVESLRTDPSRQAASRRSKNARTSRHERRLAVGPAKGKPLERAGFPRRRAAEDLRRGGGGREPSRGLEGHSATRREDEERRWNGGGPK